MAEKIIKTETAEETAKLFGSFDFNARMIEKTWGVSIKNRSDGDADGIVVSGNDPESVERAHKALECLQQLALYSEEIPEQTLRYVIDMVTDGRENELLNISDDCICITTKGRPIKARTVGQKYYVDAIRKNTIIFGIGPAGTGKTYLAVAMAVKALRDKQVSRIILTRPAIEAGEKLGFLPGDLQSKIDPYLRPLYDALFELDELGFTSATKQKLETFASLVKKWILESIMELTIAICYDQSIQQSINMRIFLVSHRKSVYHTRTLPIT